MGKPHNDKIDKLHKLALTSGLLLFLYSLIAAILFHNNRFYSSFALGSYLLLAFANYKLNRNSTIKFFLFEANRKAALVFILASTASFFSVDYYLGVQLSNMWTWTNYGLIDYVFMFIFMNIAFILGMYELHGIIYEKLKTYIPDKSIIKFVVGEKRGGVILALGLIFILLPIFTLILSYSELVKFAMIFPFLGISFIADYISFRLKGDLILEKMFSMNALYVASFVLLSFLAAFFTEAVNLFGKEWIYLNVPFMEINILTIPISVFIGWIPLVFAVIGLVNMTKNIDKYYKNEFYRNNSENVAS